MATKRLDPYNGYNFTVEVGGVQIAGFRSVSGLETTISSLTYREGGDASLSQRPMPGMVTYSNITLSRGVTSDRTLFDWHQGFVQGAGTKQNVSIILCDNARNPKIRWNLSKCWPTRWTGPSLDATGDAIAIESLELAHEGIEVDSWT